MFTQFEELPAEIRAEIWNLAFGGGHVVSNEARRHTPAAAALANRESWAEHRRRASMVTLAGRVYFNPETDIVVYSRLADHPTRLGDPRLRNDIHRRYRSHVATTNGDRRLEPPLLPRPIANPHPALRTAMIITGESGYPRSPPTVWEPPTHYMKDLIAVHERDPVMRLPRALLTDFPALETLWRVGSCAWSCPTLSYDRNTAKTLSLKFLEFRYYSASGRVMVRDMAKPARLEFWRIQRHITRSRIQQSSAYKVVVAIRIVRDRDMAPADMTDGWRVVQTFEEAAAAGQDELGYDLLPDRLWWMIFGGEIGRYIG
ncbi:hypothetical protein LY78DRAFT_11955 [Colletotrichum sublineola]|uniref:2EXR domain-containing protein n=1 Tax=Colletotrichum sublineola TaxID=1173701 RepID=A0A066XSZ9_COLSU|nr:hypothetical protein LY78DRAFT_11955 [Colletotrichum sublineola]KDN72363.1 hypothetical protein CSUB01_00046 [Colletotrichum sublineola]